MRSHDDEPRNEKTQSPKNGEVRLLRHSRSRAVPGAGRLRGHEPLELVDAGAFRPACDHLLAGGGNFDPEQDPVRQPPWRQPRLRPQPLLAPPGDRALGADDARGARKIPPGLRSPLRSRLPTPSPTPDAGSTT